MIYVKVNGIKYPAEINGLMSDSAWDNRESKTIKFLESTYEEVKALMPNDVSWSIVTEDAVDILAEEGMPTGEVTMQETEFDNSEFSVSGDITDHRDGSVSIKMGKLTDLEEAYEMIFGGDE